MERKLDYIEEGSEEWKSVVGEFFAPLQQAIEKVTKKKSFIPRILTVFIIIILLLVLLILRIRYVKRRRSFLKRRHKIRKKHNI